MNKHIGILILLLLSTMIQALDNTDNGIQQASKPFRQEGIASWYGNEFEGRPTASGEIFKSDMMTAAHPTLPFGTMLTVTNQHNGKKVTLRVNDRGPFVAERIIDVSRAAAEKLDMISTGTSPVLIELAENRDIHKISSTISTVGAPPSPSIVPTLPKIEDGKRYRVQVGSYKGMNHAVEAFRRLKNAGLNPAYERYNEYYRVVLADIPGETIQGLADQLGKAGFNSILIREER